MLSASWHHYHRSVENFNQYCGSILTLANTIILIVGSDERGTPCPVGSGVLFRVENESFLITAEHVLDDNEASTLYLPGNSEMVELSGLARNSRPLENNRDLDHFDTAYMHLSGDIVSRINEVYWFLPPELVDMNDDSTLGQEYAFTGYPHKAVKPVSGTRQLASQIHSYTCIGSETALYANVGANPKTNIVVNFDPKRILDGNGIMARPKNCAGMSRGGVWNSSGRQPLPELPNARLCGVAFEHHKKQKCLVATKINMTVEAIRSDFPDLSDSLPSSETVKVIIGDSSNK